MHMSINPCVFFSGGSRSFLRWQVRSKCDAWHWTILKMIIFGCGQKTALVWTGAASNWRISSQQRISIRPPPPKKKTHLTTSSPRGWMYRLPTMERVGRQPAPFWQQTNPYAKLISRILFQKSPPFLSLTWLLRWLCQYAFVWICTYANITNGWKKGALKPEGKGGQLLWWPACTSGHSDIQICGMKPVQPVMNGIFPLLNCFSSTTDRNRVMTTRLWKADVAVRMHTFIPAGNSNTTRSNCSSDHPLGKWSDLLASAQNMLVQCQICLISYN